MKLMILFLMLLLPVLPAQARFDPFTEAAIEKLPAAEIPLDLKVKDETGRITSLRALSGGRPVLLAPVLHNCPNICGVTLSGLMDAVSKQPREPGRDFAVIAFGIDPSETTQDAARSAAALRKRLPGVPENGVHAVTAEAEAIERLSRALGYHFAWDPKIGQYAHMAAVAVLSPDGKLTQWLYGLTPDPLDVRLALTKAGEGKTGDWSDQLLLLCYHYDPVTGQYSPVIMTALRAAGAATVAGGVLLIAIALLRQRRKESAHE